MGREKFVILNAKMVSLFHFSPISETARFKEELFQFGKETTLIQLDDLFTFGVNVGQIFVQSINKVVIDSLLDVFVE